MKFTKKEISDIKWFYNKIKARISINKVYEDKNVIPEFIKINLIKYGFFTGRIVEIIKRRINYKDLNKNKNADELMLELFGKDFFDWICKGNKKFTYGNDYNSSNNNNIYDIDDPELSKKQHRKKE